MASLRVLLASILLLLAFCLTTSRPAVESGMLVSEWNGRSLLNYSRAPLNCEAACAVRCSLASRQKICKRACGTCCKRCNCVPRGTSGNTETCLCYAKMTTHGGRLKCP